MADTNRTAVRYAKEASFAAAIGGAYSTGSVSFGAPAPDGATVVINGLTYTFETGALDAAYKVASGALPAESANNLADAINANLQSVGVAYHAGSLRNPDVIAVSNGVSLVTLYARVHGAAGDAITLTVTGAGLGASGATLTGGLSSNYATVKELRYVRHSLKHMKVTVESEEIRSDRTSSGLVKVGNGAGGDLVGEASWGDYNDFRCSAIQQPLVSGSSTATDYAISALGVLSKGAGFPAALLKAKYVKMSGWANATNNGLHRITAGNGTNSLTVENFVAEAVGPNVTVSWAYSRQGGGLGVTLESYVFDTEVTDTGIVIPLTGMCVNTWALSLQPRSKIMETFGFLGYGLPSGTSARTDTVGNAITPPSTNPIINTTSHIARLYLNGKLARAFVQSLDFTLNNNLRERLALAREGTLPVGSGQSAPGGTLVAYFDSREMYDEFLLHTAQSLEFTLVDSAGRVINVYMPKIQMGDGTTDVPGTNQDVFLNLQFKAERGVGFDTTEFQFQADFLQP